MTGTILWSNDIMIIRNNGSWSSSLITDLLPRVVNCNPELSNISITSLVSLSP